MNSFLGRHLLIDLFSCQNIETPKAITEKLKQICTDIGATVLFSHYHEFDNGGASGVIILAESHCSWHYWIDEGFIALDIFVCGNSYPENAITSILEYFKPKNHEFKYLNRGIDFMAKTNSY